MHKYYFSFSNDVLNKNDIVSAQQVKSYLDKNVPTQVHVPKLH